MPPHRIGSSAGTERLIKPINSQITTHYGVRGDVWESGHHTGTDFHADIGTAVHAAGSGTVVKKSFSSAYGNELVIRHNGHFFTQYAHLSAYAAGVAVGTKVRQGQVIGKSGDTGNTFGPHLHFEVRRTAEYGSDMNPESYFGKPLQVDGGPAAGSSAPPTRATTRDTAQIGSFASPHKHRGHKGRNGEAGGGPVPSQAAGGASTVGMDPTATTPTPLPALPVMPSIQIIMADSPALGGPTTAAPLSVVPLGTGEFAALPSAVQAQLQQFNSWTVDQQVAYLMQLLDLFEKSRDATAYSADPAAREKYARQASTTSAFLRSASPAAITQLSQSGVPLDLRLLAPATVAA